MPEEIIGRESPPPERQSDKQQHAPTGSGSTDGPKDPDAKVKQLKEEINVRLLPRLPLSFRLIDSDSS